MLRYCAWCGQFQGAVKGKGHQIRKNRCEIDTSTICPACFSLVVKEFTETLHGPPTRHRFASIPD